MKEGLPRLTPANARHGSYYIELCPGPHLQQVFDVGRERQVGLRVTPRTLGLRLGGSAILPRSTTGSDLYWCESDVKRVTWDLGGEMVSPLSSAQVATHCVAWILRCSMTSAQRLLR